MEKVAAVVLVLVILFAASPVALRAGSEMAPVRIAGHGGGELL